MIDDRRAYEVVRPEALRPGEDVSPIRVVFTNEVVDVDAEGPLFLDGSGFECRLTAEHYVRPLVRPRDEQWWRGDVAPWLRLCAIERGEAPAQRIDSHGASIEDPEDWYEVVRSGDLRPRDIVMVCHEALFYSVVSASRNGALLRDYDDQLCTIEVSSYLRQVRT